MPNVDPGLVTSKTLARHLFDAGLAPDGMIPVCGQPAIFTRLVRDRYVRWSPATEIGDVWHLVLRYGISIVFSRVYGISSITIHALTRVGTPKRLGIARIKQEADIALAIGRLSLQIRQHELTEEQEVTDGRNG